MKAFSMVKVPTKNIVFFISGILLMVVLAYVDYITGYDLNFFVFYFIPISFIAWYSGRTYAILMSFMAAIVWLYVDNFTGHTYSQPMFAYWNAFVRWTSFVILAIAISQVKFMLVKEKKLKDDLSRAFDKIKQLMEAAKRVAEGDLTVNLPVLKSDELGSLDETFNFMLKKLVEQKDFEKRLNQLERQAIMAETASFLAHEIRNPLNLIMLTAHHLGKQLVPKEENQRKKVDELICSLKSEVEQLDKVVTDFISIGKTSVLKKTRFRISEVIEQLKVMVRQQLTEKNITFQCSGDNDIDFFADQEQIRLVLLNLFVNAIAVVPMNGTIWLHAERTKTPQTVILKVTDNGSGINPDDMEKIFEPYFSRRPGGSGLGLALVKRIIEEHNGTIKVENCSGKGAQFTITLPVGE